MPSNPIVISSSTFLSANYSAWFEIIENLRSTRFAAQPIALELTTRRAGFEGLFEDNPPIETIDAVRQAADDRGIPFRSIFLPIDLSPADDKLSQEVSNINGWTDLASYLGISHVRVQLVADAPILSFRSSDIVEPVVRYMQTGDLHVSFSASSSIRSVILDWLRIFNQTSPQPVGWDYADVKDLGQWSDVPTGSVTVAMDQWENVSRDEAMLDPQVLVVVKI